MTNRELMPNEVRVECGQCGGFGVLLDVDSIGNRIRDINECPHCSGAGWEVATRALRGKYPRQLDEITGPLAPLIVDYLCRTAASIEQQEG